MHTHRDLQTAFDAALKGGDLPPGVTAHDPSEAPRRFAVYRNNVAVGLNDALAARFPVIRRLVGEVFFAAMARHYAEADRPRSAVLIEWGAGFAAFLAQFPPLAGYPYMADVARIEFARGRAFHAADAPAADPALLADADPATLRLWLHPSVTLLRSGHPAVSIWAANQPGAAGGPIPSGAEIALIWRDSTFQVPVLAVAPGDAALIDALLSQQTLAQAAAQAQRTAPGHDPQPILVRLMRAGVILTAEAR